MAGGSSRASHASAELAQVRERRADSTVWGRAGQEGKKEEDAWGCGLGQLVVSARGGASFEFAISNSVHWLWQSASPEPALGVSC